MFDNNIKTGILEKHASQSAEISGKQPESNFDAQKSKNIQLRTLFKDAFQKDFSSAVEREKALEREEEQAARQLALLWKTRDRKAGEITEANIDPSSSWIGELSKAVRSVVVKG